jgi:hypothetical protein
MKRFIDLKIRTEVFLTTVLLFFSLIGYIPTFPYMLSNTILLLLPITFLFYLNRIRFGNNSIAFIIIWLIISFLPYLVNSSEMFSENASRKLIVFSLKIFGALFAVFLGYRNSLKYSDLCKVLLFIFFVNFFLMSLQFFILKPMTLTGQGADAKWIYYNDPNPFWKRHVVGICGNTNTVGSFFLFTTVFMLDWLKRNKMLLVTVLILSITAIGLYAKSRNNILVSILFTGYYLFFIRKKLRPVLNYSLFCLMFLAIVFFSSGSEVTDSIFRFSSFEDKINSLSVRLIVNQEAINIWWNHLFLFGGGFGSETFHMAKYHSTRFYSEMLYTKSLLEMGIIGSCFSAFFIFIIYKNKCRDFFQRRLFKNLIFIVVFVSFFETVFYTQQLFYFLLFILAWLAGHSYDEDKLFPEHLNIA